jgi:hypothetical protein
MSINTPSRYEVGFGEFHGGKGRFIVRTTKDLGSEPRNRLFLPRGFEAKTKQLRRKSHPGNMIYLDGASIGLYINRRKNIYSFDHHGPNVVREFTLAPCEQVAMYSRERFIKAIGFDGVGNHDDEDSDGAGWNMLNADLLSFDDDVFETVQAHMKVAGNVDALGPGKEKYLLMLRPFYNILASNWAKVREAVKSVINEKDDYINSALAAFEVMDDLFIRSHAIEKVEYIGYKETLLPGEWRMVSVLSMRNKIMAVEQDIISRETAEDRQCCLILWQDGLNTITVRIPSAHSGLFDLAPVFQKLNQAEMEAKRSIGCTDPDTLDKKWGGHKNIGGSPRYKGSFRGRLSSFLGINEVEKIVLEEITQQAKDILSERATLKNGDGNGNGNGKPTNGIGHGSGSPVDPPAR